MEVTEEQSSDEKAPKVIQIPIFERVELRRCENPWVKPRLMEKNLSENERKMKYLERHCCAILNKLTPQKFKALVAAMTMLEVDNVEKLELICDLVFETAIKQPLFSIPYANLCRVLTDVFKSMPGNTNFRKILVNKCQSEFEISEPLDEEKDKILRTEGEKLECLEEECKEQNRKRALGNIRFIGELFKLKMISEKIMHEIILKLLSVTDKPKSTMEDHLELFSKLLNTIGKELDHIDAKPRMNQYFEQLEKIIAIKKPSSRIKFALKDVIDLRASNWVPRREVEANPKTIDQNLREIQQKTKKDGSHEPSQANWRK